MFYVYDIDGIQFKGPLEALEQQRRVEKSAAVMPIKGQEEASPFPLSPQAQAVAVYQKVIQREDMVEPLIHIYQIMSSPVSTISRDIPLKDAWWMLKEGNIRQLVVTEEKKKILGLLSDRDILRYINVIDGNIEVTHDIAVGQVMNKETVTTDSMSDIRRVARVMAFYHIDAMPVIEEERLVGIVTRGDILRGFADNPKLNLWA